MIIYYLKSSIQMLNMKNFLITLNFLLCLKFGRKSFKKLATGDDFDDQKLIDQNLPLSPK